jgi:hypothetical protein
MAKGLPYFKFISSEWITGNISYEPFEVQGLFINICALYWQRDGKLSVSEIEQRYKKKHLISKLTDRYILEIDGFIIIKFLDEQLVERLHNSKTNKVNGEKGGRPKDVSLNEIRFYLLKCYNEYEEFYKAGITKNTIKRRYSTAEGEKNKMPYKYEVLRDLITDHEGALLMEEHLKSNFEQHIPLKHFAGHKECFLINPKILQKIDTLKPTGLFPLTETKAKITNIEEEEEKEEEENKNKKKITQHLFEDSEFLDFEKFQEQFKGTDYEFCDLKIYHEKVKNWSAGAGKKKIDWIATARNFMLGDKEKGKLQLKNGVTNGNTKDSNFGTELDKLIENRERRRSASQG